MARRIGACAGSTVVAFFALTTIVSAATFYVTPVANPACPAGPNTFATIQAAVNAALPANNVHTINICAGTYPENVVIGPRKGLTLKGKGTGIVFVTGIAGTAGPIIATDAVGKVTIEALTVNGGSAMGCPGGAAAIGIFVFDTNADISNVVVKNTRNAAGTCEGVGIAAQAPGPTTRLVTVTKSLIQNATRAAISIDGDVKGTITNNGVQGPTAPNVWAPNGIELSRGAVGSVKFNTVADMVFTVDESAAGSGINVYCTLANTKVSSNTVTNSDYGITVSDTSGALVSGNEVSGSLVAAYTLQFIGDLFGPSTCPSSPTPMKKNKIQNNRAINNLQDGMVVVNYDPLSIPLPNPTLNTIANNTIDGSGLAGIISFDGSNNTFSGNKISNSDGLSLGNFDADDQQIPTPNIWKNNTCNTIGQEQNQVGLCKP